MKRAMVLLPWLVAGLCGIVSGQEGAPRRTITVTGTAEAKTAPDQVFWYIHLRDEGKDLRAVKTKNDEKVKAVVALREKLKLGEGDLETGQLDVSREYNRDEHGNQTTFKGFVVSRRVTIRQQGLKRFDEFFDALLASAEMEVSFDFASSRIEEVRAGARLKACEAARKKAKEMAEALGAKLGPVLTIDEGDQRSPWGPGGANLAYWQSSPAPELASERFVPGTMSVTATVTVSFELQ